MALPSLEIISEKYFANDRQLSFVIIFLALEIPLWFFYIGWSLDFWSGG